MAREGVIIDNPVEGYVLRNCCAIRAPAPPECEIPVNGLLRLEWPHPKEGRVEKTGEVYQQMLWGRAGGVCC